MPEIVSQLFFSRNKMTMFLNKILIKFSFELWLYDQINIVCWNGCKDKSFMTVHVFHMQMFWPLFILEGWKKIFGIYLIWMYCQIRCISFWSQIAILLYHVIKMAHFVLRTIQWYMLTFVCMMYYQKEMYLIKYKLLTRNVKFLQYVYMNFPHTHTHIYEFLNFHLNFSSQLNYHIFYHKYPWIPYTSEIYISSFNATSLLRLFWIELHLIHYVHTLLNIITSIKNKFHLFKDLKDW